MLQISSEQMSGLTERQRTKFEDRLFVHARTHLARRCEAMTDDQLRQAIAATIEKARTHDVTSELGVCLFFNVAAFFGINFVHDARIPWAFPIERRQDEPVDPVWIMRVSEIAATTRKVQAEQAGRA